MEVPAPLDAPLDAPPQDGYIEPLPTLSEDEDDDEDDAEIEAPVVRIREGYEATVSAETAAASVPAAPASAALARPPPAMRQASARSASSSPAARRPAPAAPETSSPPPAARRPAPAAPKTSSPQTMSPKRGGWRGGGDGAPRGPARRAAPPPPPAASPSPPTPTPKEPMTVARAASMFAAHATASPKRKNWLGAFVDIAKGGRRTLETAKAVAAMVEIHKDFKRRKAEGGAPKEATDAYLLAMATAFRDMVMKNGGFQVKVGQMLSMNSAIQGRKRVRNSQLQRLRSRSFSTRFG